MECVILAGGLGTRMRPLTHDIPKSLIPVRGRPFVDWQLEWLAREGIERLVISIAYKGGLLRDHVGDGRRFGIDIAYVDEGEHLRGTGGALRLALDRGVLPQRFLVLYGDSYLPISIRSVWDRFLRSGRGALMTVLRNDGQWDRSNARYEDGLVRHYDKFAKSRQGMHFIDYGLTALSRGVVQDGIPANRAFDLAFLFRDLSLAEQLAGYEVHERFYEVGSPTGLADLEQYLARTVGGSSSGS